MPLWDTRNGPTLGRRKSRASSTSCARRSRPRWPRSSRRSSLRTGRCRCGRNHTTWQPSQAHSAAAGTGWPQAIRRPGRPTRSSRHSTQPLAEPEGDFPVAQATGRRIAGLALPALGVLAAEPIYLLFDLAVVGRLGALALAGLAIGGVVLSTAPTQLTSLSYGTTARSARFYGAGDRRAAVSQGVQATWLALALGMLIVVAVEVAAVPL